MSDFICAKTTSLEPIRRIACNLGCAFEGNENASKTLIGVEASSGRVASRKWTGGSYVPIVK